MSLQHRNMNDKERIIIKIGGSVVTDKALSLLTIRHNLITRIATEIARGFDPQTQELIIVHGAGNAGHGIAKQHNLVHGSRGVTEKEHATKDIITNITALQSHIVSVLNTAGIAAKSVSARSCYVNTRGRLSLSDGDKIRQALQNGAVPVIAGTMIPDTIWRNSILSGDTIIAHLAEKLRVQRIGIASDIDGVYTKDPHRHRDATLIDTISLSAIKDMPTIGGSHATDVTGGLLGKLQSLTRIEQIRWSKNCPSITLFNGTHPENFSNFFCKSLEKKTTITL